MYAEKEIKIYLRHFIFPHLVFKSYMKLILFYCYEKSIIFIFFKTMRNLNIRNTHSFSQSKL